MQRREQQKRAAAGGGGGGGYMGVGGGPTGYSPVARFEAPSPVPARNNSPAPSSVRAPAFKGSGMKLGSKKTKQAELLDALGGEPLLSEDMSMPSTPAVANTPPPPVVRNTRGSLPEVTPERYDHPKNCKCG
jgi:coatomer subunit delta